MASNRVHGGNRIKVLSSAAHKAGDLVYERGFYGVVQDDVSGAGVLMTLILDGVWRLPRVPATIAMGKILAAEATISATTLVLLQWTTHPSLNSAATAGWNPIGRTIETGTATTAEIQLFAQNPAAF